MHMPLLHQELLLFQFNIKNMQPFVFTLSCGFYVLLAFLTALNPNKVNLRANRWLALFLLCIAGALIDMPLYEFGLYDKYPILLVITKFFILSIAPTLYFSIVYFVTPNSVFQKKDYLHFIPLLCIVMIDIMLYYTTKGRQLLDILAGDSVSDRLLGTAVLIIPLSIYWYAAFRKLSQHQLNIEIFASSTENIDLVWLRNFLYGLVVLIVCCFNDIVKIAPNLIALTPICYAGSAFYLSYFIVQQVEIFPQKPIEAQRIQNLIEAQQQPIGERKQVLSEAHFIKAKTDLLNIMTAQKPHLDSTLTLSKLADIVNITPHELSYTINTAFEDNFFGFINLYRVQESKIMLCTAEYKHLSVVGIAFEAGFNSKTAFNTAFKKITGMTPTEFQKSGNV